jgi:hypothetical protein
MQKEKTMFRNFKALFVVLLIVVVGVAAYAFAAANTVPNTRAGAGSGTVSGYTVSNVVYNLNNTDPTLLDSVNFTLDAAATTVKIRLVSSSSTWYSCTVVSGNNWTCDTTSPAQPVSTMDQLEVVATSN